MAGSSIADLVLHEANPLDDIAALRWPRRVWNGGSRV